MLLTLKIKNIALIDSAQIEFDSGLNVLSGETGSGKSVIVDSINFVLGGKADKSMIRSGEDECSVLASFSVSDELNKYIAELGIDTDEDCLVFISRKFNTAGRGDIRVNAQPISSALLKKITSALVDVHGQSEHFALLKTSAQLAAIDAFLPEIEQIKKKLVIPVSNFKEIDSKLNEIGGNSSDRARILDVLNFQIKEIEEAQVYDGEEEELKARKKKISNLEKIVTALSESGKYISGEGGVMDALNCVMHNISLISEIDKDYGNLYSRLSDILAEVDDLSSTVSELNEGLELDTFEIDEIEIRLDIIKNIKKKYGANIEEVTAFYNEAINKRELLENSEELERKLNSEKQKLIDDIYHIYCELTDKRKEAAALFSEKVIVELKQLGMEKSKFEVIFLPQFSKEKVETHISLNGADEVEFMLSPNLGEPLKPLAKIISGGELSRFMLAVKTVCDTEIDTYIFDEIDTGISGKIAKIVAEKFAAISVGKQIIAISHQPQIASMSDSSFLIYKTEENEKTFSRVSKLDKDGKHREIIRLIGGDEKSEAAAKHSAEMIGVCDDFKSKILQNKNKN